MSEAPSYPVAAFVTDPDTGERLIVERDDAYLELINAFSERYCQHPEKQTFRYKVANGSVQVRLCCAKCGQAFGHALSQKDKAWVESLPWLADDLSLNYESDRQTEKRLLLVDLARQQRAERGEFTKGYTEYLASSEWSAKRALVMKRCGGTCEGCGTKAATEVHHHTYEHLFDELLFELAGLCHGCHERITVERKGRRDAAIQESMAREDARRTT